MNNHGHDHQLTKNKARLSVAFALTLIVFFSQLIGSILTGSLALLVDTAHMFTDVLGLFMALTAAHFMLRPASNSHTWGFRRAEVLSATFQALILLGVGIYALIEAVLRLFNPSEVPGKLLLIFGAVGLVANLIALAILYDSKDSNLNMKAAFLEVLTDALGSVAVILSALAIIFFDFKLADSIAAIVIAIMILPRAIHLARSALGVLLEKTPAELDLELLREHIRQQPHVVDVQDLHVTRISSDLPVLTAHITVEESCFYDGHAPEILNSLRECVRDHFPIKIEHSTFQLEPPNFGGDDAC